jgi:predicted DsbA family dithiol-disulfide isomerase
VAYAVALGLDQDSFKRCLDERRFADAVETDVSQARALGVSGTPTFIINGQPLVGAQPIDTFRQVIEQALKETR